MMAPVDSLTSDMMASYASIHTTASRAVSRLSTFPCQDDSYLPAIMIIIAVSGTPFVRNACVSWQRIRIGFLVSASRPTAMLFALAHGMATSKFGQETSRRKNKSSSLAWSASSIRSGRSRFPANDTLRLGISNQESHGSC